MVGLRVKLEENHQKELWRKVEETGIREAAELTSYSRSKLYSWRSRDLFIPLDFVEQFIEDPDVALIKGEGRGTPFRPYSFPIEPGDELLTRVSESVYVNGEGVPFYRTYDFSLIRRFQELLEGIGEIPYEVYDRGGFYELRYPKSLQDIFTEQEFDEDLPAMVDESGVIEDGKILLDGSYIDVKQFEGELRSLRKREALARAKEDPEELQRIIRLQVSKANELF